MGTAHSRIFIDGILSKKGNIIAKASISRNYRFPTLNDLYFLPGGNPGGELLQPLQHPLVAQGFQVVPRPVGAQPDQWIAPVQAPEETDHPAPRSHHCA